MTSTNFRSFIKAFVWEMFGLIWITGVLYIWSGKLAESISINILITFIKIGGLYIYERCWKKIKWGKLYN